MTELVKWTIPASFIRERVTLTPPEVAYGLRLEWLSLDDAIKLVQSRLAREVAGTGPTAATITTKPPQVDVWIRELERGQTGDEQEVWLFLGLAWLLENRASFDDPLTVIEQIWAEFGYPKEIQRMIRWMPPESGPPVGVSGLERRWQEFVELNGQRFRNRPVI
jgi:hypothetical protein